MQKMASVDDVRVQGIAQRLKGVVLAGGLLCLLMSGCGKPEVELASVTGTVTMDGRPLPNATVLFAPINGGRSALGQTDAEGHYELQYSATASGAIVGPMRVEISTGNPDNLRAQPETVPAQYNRKTRLQVDVENKANVHNFELTSK